MSKQWLTRGDEYRRGLLLRTFGKLIVPLLIVMCVGFLLWIQTGRGLWQIVNRYWHGSTVLCPHSWYVFELLMFASAFSICSFFRLRWFSLVGTAVLASVLACIMAYELKYDWYWWFSVPAFIVGLFFAYFETDWKAALNGHRVSAKYLLLALCLICYLSVMLLVECQRISLFVMIFGALLGPLVVTVFYVTPLKRCGVLLFLGSVSYELYLVHGHVRNVLRCFLGQFSFPILVLRMVALPIGAAMVLRRLVQWLHKIVGC